MAKCPQWATSRSSVTRLCRSKRPTSAWQPSGNPQPAASHRPLRSALTVAAAAGPRGPVLFRGGDSSAHVSNKCDYQRAAKGVRRPGNSAARRMVKMGKDVCVTTSELVAQCLKAQLLLINPRLEQPTKAGRRNMKLCMVAAAVFAACVTASPIGTVELRQGTVAPAVVTPLS